MLTKLLGKIFHLNVIILQKMQDSKFKQILNFHCVDSKFRIGEKES